MPLESLSVYLVYCLEIREVGQKDYAFHDVLKRDAEPRQYSFKIIHDLPSLGLDVRSDELGRFRVKSHLS